MKALPLRNLIGILTGNAVGAETHSAAATLEFIKAAGFTGVGATVDDWGELRYITFSYPVADGKGGTTKRTLKVPLLSLLPVPLQQIQQAEYEFYTQVNELMTPAEVRAYHEAVGINWHLGGTMTTTTSASSSQAPFEDLSVTVAPYPGTAGNLKVPAMRVKLTLGQADLPAGVASTLRRIEETSGSNVNIVKKP